MACGSFVILLLNLLEIAFPADRGNWQLHTVKHVINYWCPELMYFAVQFMKLYVVSSSSQSLIFCY